MRIAGPAAGGVRVYFLGGGQVRESGPPGEGIKGSGVLAAGVASAGDRGFGGVFSERARPEQACTQSTRGLPGVTMTV